MTSYLGTRLILIEGGLVAELLCETDPRTLGPNREFPHIRVADNLWLVVPARARA